MSELGQVKFDPRYVADNVTPLSAAAVDLAAMPAETTLAESVYESHGEKIRWVHGQKKWFVFDSKSRLWVEDHGNQIERWFRDKLSSERQLAYQQILRGDKDGARVLKDVKTLSRDSSIRGAKNLLKSFEGVVVEREIFDADNNFVACAGGLGIDLKTLTPRQILPSDYCTLSLGANYDPAATCPQFERHLLTWCVGNHQLVGFLQTIVGYVLSGDTGAQAFFFLFGPGQDGKSVFLYLLEQLTGSYATTLNVNTFMLRSNGEAGSAPDLARAIGKRFVQLAETSSHTLNSSLVKSATGGEQIVAKSLYENPMEFRPKFKLFFTGNNKFILKDASKGMGRRLKVIPFKAAIPDDKVIDKLGERIVEAGELPGILNWALVGWARFQAEGLLEPDIVKEASKGFMTDSDLIGRFLSDSCERGDDFEVSGKDLYRAYQIWADEQGLKACSNIALGRQIEGRVEKQHGRNGVSYLGIRVVWG